MLAHMLSVLTSGGGLPGADVAVTAFVYGLFVTAGAFLGYLGATDVLPLFPLREEHVFARWCAVAGIAAGSLAGVLWTITDGILGGSGRGWLIALPCAFVLGWVATHMLLGRALRLEWLHPLSRTGKCVQCGYDLRATRAGRCPECGARVR